MSEMQNHMLAGSGQVSREHRGMGPPPPQGCLAVSEGQELHGPLGSCGEGTGTPRRGHGTAHVTNAPLCARNGAAPTQRRLAPTPPPSPKASSVSTETARRGGYGFILPARAGLSWAPELGTLLSPSSLPCSRRRGRPAAVRGVALPHAAAPADAAEGAGGADRGAPQVAQGALRQAAHGQEGRPGVPRGRRREAEAGYGAAEQNPKAAGPGRGSSGGWAPRFFAGCPGADTPLSPPRR